MATPITEWSLRGDGLTLAEVRDEWNDFAGTGDHGRTTGGADSARSTNRTFLRCYVAVLVALYLVAMVLTLAR